MKKIMLIYPPGKMYQRGEDRCQGNIDDSAATAMRACNDLGYAAAVLRQMDYYVYIKDFQTEKIAETDALEEIKQYNPDMLILSTTNATIFEDLKFVTEISNRLKLCYFVLKGAIFYNPEKEMLDLLDLQKIHYLVGGELDFVIRGIVKYVFENTGKIEEVNNILYKNKNGCFEATRFHVWDLDLDSQPFPARDLMNNNLYVRPDTGEPMATIQASRGCPAKCIYCLSPKISGEKVRFRSPENVYKEIAECYYQYDIKNFFFKADTFTINQEWVKQLCNLIISSPLHEKIHFTANSRVTPLKKETLSLMKQAGCFAVAFGFESGNAETLKLIKKGTTIEQNRVAISWAREVGLQVYGFYMIGFPWETLDHIHDTEKLIFEQKADFIEIHIALPYYGTELYDICKTKKTLEKQAYGSDYFNSNTTGTEYLSMNQLIDIRKKIMLKYYLNLGYIIRKIIHSIKNPWVLLNYIKYGIRMIKHLV